MSVDVTPLKDTDVFVPVKVGNHELSNKVVFAPTTRFRAAGDNDPSQLQLRYYDDRSKFPGSLIITEATIATTKTGSYYGVGGIYTKEQAQGWKKIVDKIHDNQSFASVQLWGLGRVGDPKFAKDKGLPLVAPSEVYLDEEHKKKIADSGTTLHALTTDEVEGLIYEDYAKAAKFAVDAGFDYIELHSAHGYILDTFLQSSTNKRTDKYGGSIENRARFVLELVDHLTAIVGAEKLGIRLSPWAKFQAMKAEKDDIHPITTFSFLVNELQKRANKGNAIAYISLVEPRVQGNSDVNVVEQVGSNEFIKSIWKGPLIRAGNYTYDAPDFKHLLNDVEDGRTLVGFSRFFTSNPDLVQRLHDGHSLEPYDRDLFYNRNDWGYNTYGAYGEKVDTSKEDATKEIATALHELNV